MSRRTAMTPDSAPRLSMGTAFLWGCAAGLVGAAVMTAGQKVEQLFTSRPSSYVPARTLERLVGYYSKTDNELWWMNQLHHYGQGALVGGIRGLMTMWGIRGPYADFLFTGIRTLCDQTLENWTGVGALPWTWPANEQVIDILHKAVYSIVTGYALETWYR